MLLNPSRFQKKLRFLLLTLTMHKLLSAYSCCLSPHIILHWRMGLLAVLPLQSGICCRVTWFIGSWSLQPTSSSRCCSAELFSPCVIQETVIMRGTQLLSAAYLSLTSPLRDINSSLDLEWFQGSTKKKKEKRCSVNSAPLLFTLVCQRSSS